MCTPGLHHCFQVHVSNNFVLFAGMCRGDFLKKISDSSSSGIKVVGAAHRKGENIHQWNIQQNDGAKYMSYIKVVWCHIQLYLLLLWVLPK